MRVLAVLLIGCGSSGGTPVDGSVDTAPTGCDVAKPFAAPIQIDGVNTPGAELDGWLTPDRKTIYFARQDSLDPSHVFRATRPSIAGPFNTPVIVSSLDTTGGYINRPVLSADTLEVVQTAGSTLYRSSRANATDTYSTPVAISTLSQYVAAYPWLSDDGLALTFVLLNPPSGSNDDIVQTRRATRAADFDSTYTVVQGLGTPDREMHPVISSDGLEIFFSRTPVGQTFVEIWHATRAIPTDAFGAASTLPGLDAGVTTYPVWVSPDRCELVFASNRSGDNRDLWIARRPP